MKMLENALIKTIAYIIVALYFLKRFIISINIGNIISFVAPAVMDKKQRISESSFQEALLCYEKITRVETYDNLPEYIPVKKSHKKLRGKCVKLLSNIDKSFKICSYGIDGNNIYTRILFKQGLVYTITEHEYTALMYDTAFSDCLSKGDIILTE